MIEYMYIDILINISLYTYVYINFATNVSIVMIF